jgi:hypothetical protein
MKDTRKKGAQSTPDSASVLAYHIAAILNHPDTPHGIYNALADEVTSLEMPVGFCDSQEYIEMCLRASLSGRKGGAR